MKKLKYLIFLLLFIFIPTLKADVISDYYMDIQVLDDGNLKVREIFMLEGEYENGYQREIVFNNLNSPAFNNDVESFKQSDIYNMSGVEVLEARFLKRDGQLSFADLDRDGVTAELDQNAYRGEFGKYKVARHVDRNKQEKQITMYNPGLRNHPIFYVEYILKDAVVLHQDVAEVYLNIFTEQMREAVRNMEIRVNIPGNQDEVRLWGHGPLHGSSEIVDQENLLFEIKNLNARTPLTIRFVFDKDVIASAEKTTEVEALPLILEVEEMRADAANRQRQLFQALNFVFYIVVVIWLYFVVQAVRKAFEVTKPYQTTFRTRYFRDFPNDYPPTVVSFLLNEKIERRDISATILDLIQRKVIAYRTDNKKNYIFTRNTGQFELTESEEYLLTFLFNDIGKAGSASGVNSSEFTIRDVNSYARKNSQTFINKYDRWWTLATSEARQYDFFYDTFPEEKKAMWISAIGFILFFIAIYIEQFLLMAVVFIIPFVVNIYFGMRKKRKKHANESYVRWMGLKNFLDDFGNFKERELPKIELWEKYLVYAVVFGNAQKLSKQMKIKFKEVPDNQHFNHHLLYIGTFSALNSSLSTGFTRSFNTARSTIASQSSSGGGFGGGFSGGGGFGGGGGGGGRF